MIYLLKKIAKILSSKKYTFTEEQLELMLQHANDMLKKDLQEEFKSKLETAKNSYKEIYAKEYLELEKKYNKLVIESDILKGKIKAKEREEEKTLEEINDKIIDRASSLSAEIFS